MNHEILKQYIQQYKFDFNRISHQEIYKWKAVKCFQDNWDIEAEDFYAMLRASIKLTINLLKSGNYFPLRMLENYAEQRPEEVRMLFRQLYNEEVHLYDRIKSFQIGTEQINADLFPERQTYQDHRAIMVYLAMRFPERHFLYKFKMFDAYAEKLELIYKPVTGRIENIGHFYNQCRLVRFQLGEDQELLRLHKERLGADCYVDEKLSILTQDFIYAVAKHLSTMVVASAPVQPFIEGEPGLAQNFETSPGEVDFQGKMINFLENSIENKRIGDLGELWVLKYEIEKLKAANLQRLIKDIKHTAKDEGDGTGFDIRSFNENGDPIFIEVKTTQGNSKTPFFITRTELERSKREQGSYYLYRVYDYQENPEQALLFVLHGDLSGICTTPELYKINPKL